MPDEPEADSPRQRVVRVPGARRAKLTPATGTDPSPEDASSSDVPAAPAAPASSVRRAAQAVSPRGPKGPNDDRMLQDVPPHY